jgi:hypothetical protein
MHEKALRHLAGRGLCAPPALVALSTDDVEPGVDLFDAKDATQEPDR